ncbi:MAG TPA: hypothetical protein VGD50_04875 [Candidatus Baltobacteraceae bacterium]
MRRTLGILAMVIVALAPATVPVRAGGLLPLLVHAKAADQTQQDRRESLYRAWYVRRYGIDPTAPQVREWYYRTYGVYPS